MNNIVKQTKFDNSGARNMKCGIFDDGEDDEHNCVLLQRICLTFIWCQFHERLDSRCGRCSGRNTLFALPIAETESLTNT